MPDLNGFDFETETNRWLADLEKRIQALAEEHAYAVYNHKGAVEWDDEQGWLLIDEVGKVAPNA